MAVMDEEELQELYQWVDSLPLSRPKRNIARDFSDGMLVAEVLKHFFPRLVDLHNYPQANSMTQKQYNWSTLQAKVFRKLNFEVSAAEVKEIVTCVPGAIERFLRALQTKIVQIQQKKRQREQEGLHGGGFADTMGSAARPSAAPPAAFSGPRAAPHAAAQADIHVQVIREKDETIRELKETIDILELKVQKLEQLVQLKDTKIQSLTARLAPAAAPLARHR
eukprot:TRINITY_DN67107_c0_g1_i1.p1 TRINITY_DN67107_c0_g1~~TRINITY_DN67107_c0_g1_i1.p1  ORF type:complete len:252 (+),score=105.69 TRINITY_DN67107_c0_g1_i1:92-757(+)